jgi:multidrug efflux pump subunit AcrA (membrane-fusion protein)
VKRNFLILWTVIVLGVGGYYYWRYLQGMAPESTAVLASASTVPPTPGSMARLSSETFSIGIVVPLRYATLSMGSSGKIAEILVKEGELVEANQPLVRLVSSQQAVAVTQAEANLRAAQAKLAKLQAGPQAEAVTVAEAAVDIAQANLDKISADAQDPTIATSQSAVAMTIAEAELRRAEAELALLQRGALAEDIVTAEAEMNVAEADLQANELVLAASELQAPFAGTVASIDFEVGEYVAADDVVLTVSDFDAWQIESTELDEVGVVNVAVGDKVEITFDAIPDLELTGTLTHIKPVGTYDEGNVTYTIIVVPDQRDARVRWNMTAQLTIKS